MLNRSDMFGREDGFRRDRARDGLFPRLKHLVHLPPRSIIDFGVRSHEDGVELRPKIEGIWRRNILDHRVQYVESRQRPSRWDLLDMVRENFGDRQAMARVLPRDVSQGRDFDTRVHSQVFQGLPIVIGHVVGVVRHGYVGANGVEGDESVGKSIQWWRKVNVGWTRNQAVPARICEPEVSEYPSVLLRDAQSANSAARAIEKEKTIGAPTEQQTQQAGYRSSARSWPVPIERSTLITTSIPSRNGYLFFSRY